MGRTLQVIEREKKELLQKSKRKRIIFIRRMVALSFLMIGLLSIFSFASDLFDEDRIENAIQEKIAQYEKVDIIIQEGDRAWNIQQELTPDVDVRDVLDLVEVLNQKNSIGDIKAGEMITFLKEKTAKIEHTKTVD